MRESFMRFIARIRWHLLFWYMCRQKTYSTDEQVEKLESFALKAWGQKDKPRRHHVR